ncbi:MAG: hypothetical protein KBT84_07590 [Pseudomonas sp.]|nr:hypothetical protein [Pseudomonas sp.]
MMLPNQTLRQRLSLSSCIVAVLLLNPAVADTIEGSLNGESKSWNVLKQQGASTATFSELTPGMQTVRLQGHVEQKFATQGTLSINFTLMNGSLISPPEVTYFHTNGFMPNYGNQDTPAGWELSVSEIEGDSAHFVGRYEGTLKLQGKPEGNEPDTLELAVEFDVRASKDE